MEVSTLTSRDQTRVARGLLGKCLYLLRCFASLHSFILNLSSLSCPSKFKHMVSLIAYCLAHTI